MRWAGAVIGIVENNNAEILLGLLALVLILLLLDIRLHARVGKLSKRKQLVQQPLDQEAIEVIEQGLEEAFRSSKQLAILSREHEQVASRQSLCVQKVGVIRFNAFHDMGGEQSFALALLDGSGNGVLLSSLLSRSDCRTYAKVITAGKSEQALSQEEQQALSHAMRM